MPLAPFSSELATDFPLPHGRRAFQRVPCSGPKSVETFTTKSRSRQVRRADDRGSAAIVISLSTSNRR